MIIVGSGILGLSVAEYFSRPDVQNKTGIKHIKVISDQHPLAGSPAASANLAIKAQRYARDAHFALKLKAHTNYYDWLSHFTPNPYDIYKQGYGVDYFASSTHAEMQLHRVLQSQQEIKNRGLPPQNVMTPDKHTIVYSDESWVDAKKLLKILTDICLKRNVVFIKQKVTDFFSLNDHIGTSKQCIVFCTGAWTSLLLKKLEIDLPKTGQHRVTLGSVFEFSENFENINCFQTNLNQQQKAVILEEIDIFKNRITISGNQTSVFTSAGNININEQKINEIASTFALPIELNNANKDALVKVQQWLQNRGIDAQKSTLQINTGIRVGYGHSELLLYKSPQLHKENPIFICSGAHKSGYLFAAIIGETLHKLHIDWT